MTLTFKETIYVPFHDFVKRTNINLDTTKRKDDDNNSHSPVLQADQQDPEIQVFVTPSAVSLRSKLKPQISNLTENRSPPRTPSHKNEIRAAMTSSPSSPQSPEHSITEMTKQPEISTTNAPDAHKAGTPPPPLQIKPSLPQPEQQGVSNGH